MTGSESENHRFALETMAREMAEQFRSLLSDSEKVPGNNHE